MSGASGVVAAQRAARPALRPLALPSEHGGWGLLFEPLVLGMAVAPSRAGALVAMAFVLAFLTRHPLKLALQDGGRGKSYPRTRWCWIFAASYAGSAAIALAAAILVSGWELTIPLVLAVPPGLVQIAYDSRNRSRTLLPEIGGAVAMSSSAAAIGVAGGLHLLPAVALSGVLVARSIPSIVYVRTLLQRAHGGTASSVPALVLHVAAVATVAFFAAPLAAVAMTLLLARAAWQLHRPVPPANRIGWSEIGWGAVTVGLVALG